MTPYQLVKHGSSYRVQALNGDVVGRVGKRWEPVGARRRLGVRWVSAPAEAPGQWLRNEQGEVRLHLTAAKAAEALMAQADQ